MSQTGIPYLFMRGGTSRGPYFDARDLPSDREHLAEVLISVLGAGNPRNIDGLGGGNAVTTKVAILSAASEETADVNYFFAQVAVEKREVDFSPTCGNILVGVGPAAIEMGLVPAKGARTELKIRAVNTGALVEAEVLTRDGVVIYDGDTQIDGVPGTAAPVALNFLEVTGSRTGAMFPTGHRQEKIDGIDVSLVDVAMPMMIARAGDLGLSGHETQEELDGMPALFERMEALRHEAGRRMGFGDVTQSVVPKIGLIAEPRHGGHFAARYFMPWTTHPTLAVTGSQCLAACALAPGTVAEGLVRTIDPSPAIVKIEHPMGEMEVKVRYEMEPDFAFIAAGVTRTARLIARGEVMVPKSVWDRG